MDNPGSSCELFDWLERANDFGRLASIASDVAEALVEQHLFDQASEWTQLAEKHAASDDLDAQVM